MGFFLDRSCPFAFHGGEPAAAKRPHSPHIKNWIVSVFGSLTGRFNVKSDGILYLSTLRLIFVADRPTESFTGLVGDGGGVKRRIFRC